MKIISVRQQGVLRFRLDLIHFMGYICSNCYSEVYLRWNNFNVIGGISGVDASGFVENQGEQSGFQSKHVKEEETTGEDLVYTTTVWG